MLDTIAAQKLLPVVAGGDQRGEIFRKKGFWMGIKGDGGSLTVQLPGQISTLLQQCLMAHMHAVKKTQRINSFFVCHNLTKSNFSLLLRCALHPKAFPLRGRWHGASRDG